MNDCRFGVSPVNYPDPDPDLCYFYCAFKNGHFAILQRLFDNLSLVKKVYDEECLSIKTLDGNNIYYFHLILFSGFRGTASQVDFPL